MKQKTKKKLIKEILKNTKHWIYAPVKAYIKNPFDIEDVCQNVFLKLCNNALETYNPNEELGKWVRVIAANKAKDFLKGQRRHNRNYSSLDTEEETQTLSIIHNPNTLQPLDRLIRDEELSLLKQRLPDFPEQASQAFLLYYQSQLSQTEIAQIQGIAKSTARNRIHSTRDRIRETLLSN